MVEVNQDDKIVFNSCKILHLGDKTYMICGETFSVFEIDSIMEKLALKREGTKNDLFNIRKGENYSLQEFEELLEQLIEKKVVEILKEGQNQDELNNTLIRDDTVSGIVLMIVQECNLRCSYCYGQGGEYSNRGHMSFETGKKAIDFLMKNSKTDEVNICFFGGEPLIQFELITRLVTYAREVAELNNKKVGFSITTNGTLLTDEISEYLMKNKFSITLSIDGDKETTNINRYNANGVGVYDTIIEKSEKLRHEYAVSARGTITKNSLNILHSHKHLRKLEFSNVQLSGSVNMLEDKHYEMLASSYKECVQDFFKLVKEEKYREASTMSTIYKFLERIHYGGYRKKGCGAGNHMLCIDIDENIYPCHRFVSCPEFAVGNLDKIEQEKLDRILHNMQIESSERCRECWIKVICGGGCPYENYEMNGKTNEPYMNNCKLYKEVIELCLVNYLYLSEEQRRYLFPQKRVKESPLESNTI